ncbi:type II toxin-antitoxin system RelE/ParE family toxin [Rhodoferax sediminis]|jgi:putative addiction module killer protein|uniref:Type II toxin-antitoxin system RelE/ParE family toxin n=1 Tax=Rhodoferax sediminis TaxID=2509614 RepID=A0A515DD48_9BURK|nr:type II toxin-antitoxin system RelE/ParE family toxin [Rhodoferax sediminis]QDL38336.1 type II toxin-antitoxin system RelE/ParE family toxin [Rhodoferax sediminis]
MFEIIKTETFEHWLLDLKDRMARFRIQARVDRLASGNTGDFKPLRNGISELRIDFGPGYRVYFMRSGPLVIVLLAGGDKRTQDADIERAIAMAKDWKA